MSSTFVKCRTCGGREVEKIVLREGERERVIVQCRFCECRRNEYTRIAKNTAKEERR
jgi:predicted DNA-binding antitoxin AbrB/MazE fold protein